MQEPLLPLFPLEVVLLPGTPMPLHIFEDRYKEMVGKAMADKTEFGIVQAGGNGILNIGCTATVERVVRRYEDGRMDIVVIGRRRFEIILLDEQEAYLRGAVTFFDDDDDANPAPIEMRREALAGLHALQQATGDESDPMPESTDPRLSFKIAFFVPELPVRQTLLALRSETDRLKHLNEYLPQYIVRQRHITRVRTLAPQNGHGLKAPE